jgi:hypothetical protein
MVAVVISVVPGAVVVSIVVTGTVVVVTVCADPTPEAIVPASSAPEANRTASAESFTAIVGQTAAGLAGAPHPDGMVGATGRRRLDPNGARRPTKAARDPHG